MEMSPDTNKFRQSEVSAFPEGRKGSIQDLTFESHSSHSAWVVFILQREVIQ